MQKRTECTGLTFAKALKAMGAQRMLTRVRGCAIEDEAEVGGHPAKRQAVRAAITPSQKVEGRPRQDAGKPAATDLGGGEDCRGAKPRNAGVKLGGRVEGGGGSWEGLGLGRLRHGWPPAVGVNAGAPRRHASRERGWVTVIIYLW